MSPTRIFCPTCSEVHEAQVDGVDGWPTVTWLTPHVDERRRHLDAIVDLAAEAFAAAAAGHHWTVAERFLAEVLGDDEEDRAG